MLADDTVADAGSRTQELDTRAGYTRGYGPAVRTSKPLGRQGHPQLAKELDPAVRERQVGPGVARRPSQ